MLVCYKGLSPAKLMCKNESGSGAGAPILELGQSFEHSFGALQITSATSEVLAALQ